MKHLLVKVVLAMLLFQAWSARPATIAMNASDALGTTSFNTGLNWSGGLAPSSGNDYQTAGYLLRTPANASDIAFAGNSLELQSGSIFRDKTSATVTVTNFILDSGSTLEITQPNNVNDATAYGSLAGNITLNGTVYLHAGISTDVAGEAFYVNSTISGTGGFDTTGSTGNVFLNGTNTYSGLTLVNAGTLLINGAQSASPVTVTAGVLGGTGIIKAAVTNQAGGTLLPGLGGTDTSTLTISNNLVLAGNTIMTLNRGNAQKASKIAGISTLTQGGTLTVTNAGAALQVGDTFTLFTAGSYTGSFASVILPSLSTTMQWSNSISVNGTIAIVTNTSYPAGTWTNDASGNWSTATNWSGSIPNGSGVSAYFNLINITSDRTVTLDSSRTIGNLYFGDTSGLQNWFLNNSNGSILTLAGTPTITVDNNNTTLNLPLAGTQGLAKAGTGTLVLGGNNAYSGATLVNAGTMAVSGTSGGTAAANTLTVGNAAGKLAVLKIQPGANLSCYTLAIGGNATGPGAVFQSGGSLTQSQGANIADFRIGGAAGAYGYFNLSGGTLTVNEVGVGSDLTGSVGVMDVTGGNYVSSGYVTLARGIDTLGALNVSGGTMSLSGTVGNSTIGLLWNGSGASFGLLNIFGSGAIIGPANTTYILNYNPFSGGGTLQSGVVNLGSGGLLQIGGVNNSAPAVGTTLFNFTGGTLKAQVSNAAFFPDSVTGAYVYGGGAIIDDNGAAISFAEPLRAPTGYGVSSIVLTSGGSNYIGAPFVLVTGGSGVGATAIAQGDFASGQITNILVTSPGTGYANSDTLTVTLTGGGGSGAAIGTVSLAPNASGGLMKTGAGTLTLAGANTYTGETIVSSGTLLLTGSLAGGAMVANGATLSGNGKIAGVVTNQSGGTLQPGLGGTDTSTLAVSNSLVLAGTTVMTLNRTNSQLSARITGINNLSLGGTLTVLNAGPPLQADDSFTLFNAGATTGSFSVTNLPSLSGGLVWTNLISVNGTIVVLSTLAPTNPVVTNLPASQVYATSAKLNGQVLSTGGQVPNVTIFYGLNNGGTNAANWSNSIPLGPTTGTFSAATPALATNTTYYFTAFASNSAGTGWAIPSQNFTTLAANPSATRIQVVTYHYDNSRQGQNTNETLLTHANVNTNKFGKLFSYAVDGYVYSEPLIMTNVTIPGQGVHNVVFITTEHNTVYAFDADSNAGTNGGLLWKTNLGIASLNAISPYGRRYTGVNPYSDITPEVGATGTPVIDPATGTLYVNVFTREPSGNATNYIHRIHALDVTTGNERPYSPVVVAGSVPGTGVDSVGGVMTFNAIQCNQRPALALSAGKLYVAYAGYADTDPYHGWLFAYNATNLTLATNYIFNTTPNASISAFGSHAAEGGIWQGGGGLCIDTNGNVYFETGNGSFSASTNGGDYADTFLKLSTTNGFAIADYFTPYNQASLASADLDLGACGPIILPDSVGNGTHPHLLAGMGKDGKVYLIDRDNMGHYQAGSDSQIVQSFDVLANSWAPPSYWNGLIYCQPSSSTMASFSISNASINTTPVATASSAGVGIFNGGPVISANGTKDGIVWVINNNGGSTGGAGTLYALNATNISQVLFSSAQLPARDSMGYSCKMTTPTVAGGRVYVPGQYVLSVYGLATFLPAPDISPAGGVFTNSIMVSISDANSGVDIYYTLDGSAPSAGSTLYTGPFVITDTTKVQAIAVQSGYVDSAVTTADFVSSASLPPPPWETSDIGSVAATGSGYFSNGVFIVTGSGADIWGAADAFRFVYQPLSNNCEISARVTSQGNTDPWAKAGVMIRDSLAANSAYAYTVITPGNGFDFQYRSQNGISSDGNIYGGALNTPPDNWVRLARTNNTFTAYVSADGVNWTMVGSPTLLSFVNTVYYVGLAVTAHNDGALSTATFDNVTVNGLIYSNPPPVVVINAPTDGASYTATATVTISADADALYDTISAVGFYANSTYLGSVSNAPYTLTATGLAAGNYALTAVALSSSGLMSTSAVVNITVNAGSGQPYGLTNRTVSPAYFNLPTTSSGSIPALLSQVGIFSNTATMTPVAALIPYSPNTVLWSDGAVKTRYFAVPNNGGAITPDQQISFTETGPWTFPAGTVFVKTFELNTVTTNPAVKRRLETRVLVRDSNGQVYGATYKWRADNSDADLLSGSLLEDILITNATGVSTQTWYYPSRADCLTCHTPVANYVLGVKTAQLNGDETYSATGVTDNQLRALNHLGLFNAAFNDDSITNFAQMAALTKATASLEKRVRSYLDANCVQCHQPGGTGPTFDARFDTPLASQNLINGGLDADGFAMIVPKDRWRSEIWDRMNTTNDAIKMPPLARSLIDSNAVQVLTDWINSLPGIPALAPPVFTPNGGSYVASVNVSAQQPDTNAAIYYTLDGSKPTTNSLLYAGPITLLDTATVSASSFRTGYVNSVTASATFLVEPLHFTTQGFTNNVFQLTFRGQTGSNYVLYATTNFINWTAISTNTAVSNQFNFYDAKATNYSYRFYRVQRP